MANTHAVPARAGLHLVQPGPTAVRDIAERTALPQPYLEQILLALKGAGLVRSKRGVGGGYVLARDPSEITLAQVVSAVDGPIVVGDFGEPHQNGACDHEGQCVLLAVWADAGRQMRTLLEARTLADVAAITPARPPGPAPATRSGRSASPVAQSRGSSTPARSSGSGDVERDRLAGDAGGQAQVPPRGGTAAARAAPGGPRRSGDRRRRGARSTGGGPGSGGCARSPGARAPSPPPARRGRRTS